MYWNAQIIRFSAFTLKVLQKVLMRKEDKYYSVSQERMSATGCFKVGMAHLSKSAFFLCQTLVGEIKKIEFFWPKINVPK